MFDSGFWLAIRCVSGEEGANCSAPPSALRPHARAHSGARHLPRRGPVRRRRAAAPPRRAPRWGAPQERRALPPRRLGAGAAGPHRRGVGARARGPEGCPDISPKSSPTGAFFARKPKWQVHSTPNLEIFARNMPGPLTLVHIRAPSADLERISERPLSPDCAPLPGDPRIPKSATFFGGAGDLASGDALRWGGARPLASAALVEPNLRRTIEDGRKHVCVCVRAGEVCLGGRSSTRGPGTDSSKLCTLERRTELAPRMVRRSERDYCSWGGPFLTALSETGTDVWARRRRIKKEPQTGQRKRSGTLPVHFLTLVGPLSPRFERPTFKRDKTPANFGRDRPKSGPCLRMSGRTCQMLTKSTHVGEIWPEPAKFWPIREAQLRDML